MEFNIGDFIIMKRSAPYGFTQYKSTGTVVEVLGDHLEVEFDYLSGEGHIGEAIFTVEKIYCKHTKQITQQERICNKIKLMESRWLTFQKRKHSYV